MEYLKLIFIANHQKNGVEVEKTHLLANAPKNMCETE